MKLTDKCGYYQIARNSKELAVSQKLGKNYISSYKNIGCYECNGWNVDCPKYFSPLEMYKKGNNKLNTIERGIKNNDE